ncbi:MAG: hypothetical protein ACKO0M_01505 [Cyanobium sp.]
MPLPLLLALTPLPSDAFVPFQPPAPADGATVDVVGNGTVETFDPVARAGMLAGEMPRLWTGTYRPYGGGAVVPAQLRLESLNPMGQLIDLRGQLSIGSVTTPVQGNLNAKSDQLDLLLLGPTLPAGLESGGTVMGLQGFSLSGWQPPRLTSLGGRLELMPQRMEAAASPTPAPAVRGLW